MRLPLLLLGVFFLMPTGTSGQNYYVATVRGEVYYQDSLLQKRDKITLEGNIRFTDKENYVRLSGPGGLFTLRPGMDSSSGNEFLIALRKELFPELRMHMTAIDGVISVDGSSYFFMYGGVEYTFLQRTKLGKIPGGDYIQELGYLHDTGEQLVYRTARVEDSCLILREADFTIPDGEGNRRDISYTAIVAIYDTTALRQFLAHGATRERMEAGFLMYRTHTPPVEVSLGDGKQSLPETTAIYPGMRLDEMGPTRFVSKEEIVNDLRFHIELCHPDSWYQFLEEFEYWDYIRETYGNFYDNSMEEVRKAIGLPLED